MHKFRSNNPETAMVSSPTQMISVIQMAVLKAVLDKRYSRDITCCVHYPRKYFASSGSLQNNTRNHKMPWLQLLTIITDATERS